MDSDAESIKANRSIEEEKAAQELINLQLEAEKTRIEIAQLRRPLVFSNPQLATAVVTTIGALVGAYILISQNYFQALRAGIDATKTLSDQSVKDAEQKGQLAKKIETEAEELQHKAEQTERDASARIAQANNQVLEANRRVARVVEADLRKDLATWNIPGFVYDQQAQLSSLRLSPLRQRVLYLSWLTAPLTTLAVGVLASSALTQVPRTVSVLDITTPYDGGDLDFSKLSSPSTITDLTVRLHEFRSNLERGPNPDPVRISGLKQLRNLRSLAIESDGPVTGLDDVVDLTTLQRLSFIGDAAPSDIISRHFQQPPSPESKTRVDSYPSDVSGGIMPEVRTVRIVGDASGLMATLTRFPNVDDLSLKIGLLSKRPDPDTSDEDASRILPWIAQRTNLRALDLEFGSLVFGSAHFLYEDRLFVPLHPMHLDADPALLSHAVLDVSNLHQLERLSLRASTCFEVTGLKGLTALKELRVQPSILLDMDLSVLPRLERLTVLGGFEPSLLASLAHVGSLNSLCIPLVNFKNDSSSLQDRAELEKAYITLLGSVPLEHLRISPASPIRKLPTSIKDLEFADTCEDTSSSRILVLARK